MPKRIAAALTERLQPEHLPGARRCGGSSRSGSNLAGGRVQNERSRRGTLAEIQHSRDRIGDPVERTGSNALGVQPVVLDEANDRGLIRYRVVNEVTLLPRRDNQQGHTRTVATATLGVRHAADSGKRAGRAGAATESVAG